MLSKITLSFLFTFQLVASPIESSQFTWKSIFVAGDNSILNFDRARVDLANMFIGLGADTTYQIHYSVMPQLVDNQTVYVPTLEPCWRIKSSGS